MAAVLGVSSSMLLERPLEEAIEFAAAQGFRAFEVWGDHPHAHPDETTSDVRRRLASALRTFDRVSVHGPLGNASLASINPGIWRESVRQHIAAAELAHDIGAGLLVCHPGDLRDRRFKAEALRLSCEALGTVAMRAAKLGVTIAIENCGPFLAGIDQTVADLVTILGSLDPGVRICIDTGHASVNRNAVELLSSLGDAVGHLHVHDNHGTRDEHLPIGAGTIDYSPYVPFLKRLDVMAISEIVWEREGNSDAPEALARATQDGWASLFGKTR